MQHTSLQPLAQLLTTATLGIVSALCARSHHQQTNSDDTFLFPPFLGYLMLGGGLFFILMPLLPGAAGNESTTRFFLMFTPFWGCAFLGAIYFFRYRVVITDTTLTVGAFRPRRIACDDIIDWDVVRGQRSSELRVYLRDGRELCLSGLLGDFEQLAGTINSHMAIPPPGHTDSAAKLHDRAARRRNGRLVA